MTMLKDFLHHLRVAILATVVLAVLLCGVYPLVVWAVAQAAFPAQANGSLIVRDGKVVGSALLGQQFTEPRYFHPRPSAAGDGYNPLATGGSNLGPLNPKLLLAVKERIAEYRKVNALPPGVPVPVDAVTASGSGLDPHISVANAMLQAPRVARVRGLGQDRVRALVAKYTEGPDLGILGNAGVNVVRLNLALDLPVPH